MSKPYDAEAERQATEARLAAYVERERSPAYTDSDAGSRALNSPERSTVGGYGSHKEYVIHRTGNIPLAFNGRVLARDSNHETSHLDGAKRWHSITVYQTTGGNFVAQLDYTSDFGQELPFSTAFIGEDAGDLVRQLYHLRFSYVQGYPPRNEYSDKQHRLMTHINLEYLDLLNRVVAEAFPDAVERIE
jgi:hypothetical protein